ncbi:MAG TPA: hypothetical protein DCG75_16050 [Bacteroidales bacterium]|nr:hypothetical protein [Bacteroidales bacterium]
MKTTAQTSKSQRINLRMRINNQVRDTKESIVTNLMTKHNLRDFDKGLMLFVRCMNDQKVRNLIISVSENHVQ